MTSSSPQPFQLHTLTICDPIQGWEQLGFSVVADTNPGMHSVQIGSTTLVIIEPQSNDDQRGLLGWHVDSVDGDIDGLATHIHQVAPTATDSHDDHHVHANGISSIDHIVVRTGDSERSIAAFEAVGLTSRRGRTTSSYGSPMLQTFFWLGDVILELVGPAAGEPTTDESPSFFGLACVAADLSATAATLGDLLGTPRAAVQDQREIAGLRTQQVGVSVPVVVMSPHMKTDSGS